MKSFRKIVKKYFSYLQHNIDFVAIHTLASLFVFQLAHSLLLKYRPSSMKWRVNLTQLYYNCQSHNTGESLLHLLLLLLLRHLSRCHRFYIRRYMIAYKNTDHLWARRESLFNFFKRSKCQYHLLSKFNFSYLTKLLLIGASNRAGHKICCKC